MQASAAAGAPWRRRRPLCKVLSPAPPDGAAPRRGAPPAAGPGSTRRRESLRGSMGSRSAGGVVARKGRAERRRERVVCSVSFAPGCSTRWWRPQNSTTSTEPSSAEHKAGSCTSELLRAWRQSRLCRLRRRSSFVGGPAAAGALLPASSSRGQSLPSVRVCLPLPLRQEARACAGAAARAAPAAVAAARGRGGFRAARRSRAGAEVQAHSRGCGARGPLAPAGSVACTPTQQGRQLSGTSPRVVGPAALRCAALQALGVPRVAGCLLLAHVVCPGRDASVGSRESSLFTKCTFGNWRRLAIGGAPWRGGSSALSPNPQAPRCHPPDRNLAQACRHAGSKGQGRPWAPTHARARSAELCSAAVVGPVLLHPPLPPPPGAASPCALLRREPGTHTSTANRLRKRLFNKRPQQRGAPASLWPLLGKQSPPLRQLAVDGAWARRELRRCAEPGGGGGSGAGPRTPSGHCPPDTAPLSQLSVRTEQPPPGPGCWIPGRA